LVSHFAGKKKSDNNAFFIADKQSLWWAVAIGMVGSSMSGVSFVSVPGMVRGIDFTYMQFVLGFVFGYIIVAKVLLPLFYRNQVISIYSYLGTRFGEYSYRTGAWFFIIGKIIATSAKLYIVALVLHNFVFAQWHIPFAVTVFVTVFMIWLYTFRSGIKSIVWTDVLQTLIMFAALIIITIEVANKLDFSFGQILTNMLESERTNIFVFDDWVSRQNFFKQFFSGIFIVVVMTGLDQDQMQKNLTCRNLPEAQKNMYWYGAAFVPVNLLFLVLGFLLLLFAEQNAIDLSAIAADDILPVIVNNNLGNVALITFVIGITASAFNSADSALTSLTTSFSVDILKITNLNPRRSENIRKTVHIAFSLVLILVVMLFRAVNDKSVIDALYTIVSYTYGPLLGMFAFGLFTKRSTRDRLVPAIAILSPIICWIINYIFTTHFAYRFGYELLMLNALLTFMAMGMVGKDKIM
jgi:SSS family transporter